MPKVNKKNEKLGRVHCKESLVDKEVSSPSLYVSCMIRLVMNNQLTNMLTQGEHLSLVEICLLGMSTSDAPQ
jgi:hypothetical protein